MTQAREVATCMRCRGAKRKCDQARPNCSRCDHAQARCTYEDDRRESSSSPWSFQDITSATASSRSTPTDTSLNSTTYRITKKRNRACLSCVRCHRLKIKCDKKQPCGRCSRSGFMDTCKYSHIAKRPLEQSPASIVLTGEDPESIVAAWFLRKRSSGYNRALLDCVSQ
jgi:hypothetical protein